jgi:hypothetical protein
MPTNEISALILQEAFDTAWAMLEATRGASAVEYNEEIRKVLRERIAAVAATGETDPRVLAKDAIASLFLSPNS